MHIIEQHIKSKSGQDEICEDGIAANEHFIAVIDGVTNKSTFSFESKSPGRIAMELIREAVLGLAPDSSAADAVAEINRHIRRWYTEHGFLETMRLRSGDRCCASLALFSAARKEIWFVGDCQALANGALLHPQKDLDRIFSDLRAMLIHVELAQGKTEKELLLHDTCRERLLDLIKLQSKLQNTAHRCEFSYYVIDGFDWDPGLGLEVFPLNQPGGEVVLASDGYPMIFPSLDETEAFLASVLADDPLCYKKYRSTKGCYGNNVSFDDRCYIRFRY